METDSTLYSTSVIESNFSHYIIFGCAIFSVAWGLFNSSQVNKIQFDVSHVKVNTDEKDKADPEKSDLPWTPQACLDEMLKTN